MNLKACTFEKRALISLGCGRGAQVGKTSLLEVEFIFLRRKRLRWAYSIFHLVRFRPWDPAQTLDLSKKTPHFFTMRSEDSETAHLLGSGPVLRHNNACVRDVLTAPSNVYLSTCFIPIFNFFINIKLVTFSRFDR